MYESSAEGQKDLNGSDARLVAALDFCNLYHRLAERRNLGFAQAVLENAHKSNLDYDTTKLTLEAVLALAAPPEATPAIAGEPPKANHIEALPEAVALVYALTPEKTKERRMAFLNELKQQPYREMPLIREKALSFYAPDDNEIRQYVKALPIEGHALLLKSGESRWDTLAANYPKYKEMIIHFSRIESQFKVRLRDYLPPPSSS